MVASPAPSRSSRNWRASCRRLVAGPGAGEFLSIAPFLCGFRRRRPEIHPHVGDIHPIGNPVSQYPRCTFQIRTAGREVAAAVNMTVGRDVDVKFLVSQENPDIVTFVIGASVAEIGLDLSTVESLHAAIHELRAGQRS